jgi:hypothetical protein
LLLIRESIRYFGNEILSPWPIGDQERIVLPHKNPQDGQMESRTSVSELPDSADVPDWPLVLSSPVDIVGNRITPKR